MSARHSRGGVVWLPIVWLLCAPGHTLAEGPFPSENVTLLSQVSLEDFPGGPIRGNDCWGYVSPSGREYALMGLYNEVAVVEITNPSNPVIIAEIPHTASNWADIKVWQDHAYAVNEAGGGMDVIDLSQVDAGIVTLVQRVTTDGLQTTHNLAIDTTSGFLYLCDANINGGRLVAFDLSDPANPVIAGQMDVVEGTDVHDAQVVTYTTGPYAGRQIAFASAGGTGIDIYDVTQKDNMFRLSRSTYPNLNFAHQCWTEDLQYLYVNDELDGINESVIFDISDLTAPVFVGTYSAGLMAIDHNQYVHDGFIYESDYSAGLRIFDASDPVNPVQVGWFDTYPDSDAAATVGTWSNYPFFPSGNVIISSKEEALFVVRPGPPPIAFGYPGGLPERIDAEGDSFLVDIVGEDGETLDPASPVLHYDAGGGLVEVPMNSLGGSLYEAVFDMVPCPELVQFYVSATTTSGITIKDPISAPT
ncbi:MAG: choice-of-anchor B family protein, partial [Acidobacteriota bacterium]|nr:choice-of-anchor B family protein [Acidobacteriota bacterium]